MVNPDNPLGFRVGSDVLFNPGKGRWSKGRIVEIAGDLAVIRTAKGKTVIRRLSNLKRAA